jgi:hypothetical protein
MEIDDQSDTEIGEPSIKYSYSLLYMEPEITLSLENSTVSFGSVLGYNRQYIDNKILNSFEKERFFFSPQLSLSQKFLKHHSVTLSGSYRQSLYSPQDYVGYFTNYRSFHKPAQNYKYGSERSLSALYSYFSPSGTSVIANYIYTVTEKSFTDRQDISSLMDYETPFEPQNRSMHIGFMQYKQYIDPIRHGFQIDANLYGSNFVNAVNTNTLRNNKMLSSRLKLSLKSVYDFPVNYMLGIRYGLSSYKISVLPAMKSYNYSLFQDLNYKVNARLLMKISFDEHFLGRDRKFYFFVKPDISYKFNKQDITVSISAYNLLDIDRITDYQLSDYYSMESYYKIVPAQYLLSVQFRF